MRLVAVRRAVPLAALTAAEMAVPFIRMIILTHILGPYEFGFAAALSAIYATVEQLTDTALFRFVLAAKRELYKEALATAHGIALLRGLAVTGIFLSIAYPVGCGMVACGEWLSFAWLAPLALIKSFENLELRVYERDYRYWPQFAASICSHSCGLLAMTAVGLRTGSHQALLAYLIVQALAYVALTHLLAHSPYKFVMRGPLTKEALRYSAPLLLNGVGLAIMAQGDRLFVGTYLGLETLGLYAIMILTAYVPTSGLFRMIGPVQFAGLMNSADRPAVYTTRLQLYGRTVPLIAAVYALGWIVLGKPLIPTIFGPRFVVSEMEVLLIGLIVYLRICRTEPATSLLLQRHGTAQLAIANQLPLLGLCLGALFTWLRPNLESLLLGTVIGEALTLAVMLGSVRTRWKGPWIETVIWSAGLVLVPLTVSVSLIEIAAAERLLLRISIGVAGGVLLGILATIGLRRLAQLSYKTTDF